MHANFVAVDSWLKNTEDHKAGYFFQIQCTWWCTDCEKTWQCVSSDLGKVHKYSRQNKAIGKADFASFHPLVDNLAAPPDKSWW